MVTSSVAGSQVADVNVAGVCTTCDSRSNNPDVDSISASFVGDLSTNTSVARVNFGYNVPAGAFTLGDTVFHNWNGNGVKDPGDEGIAGVTVYPLVDMDGDGNYAVARSTTTDSSGGYLFDNLPDGSYRVAISPADGSLPDDAFGNPYVKTTGTQGAVALEPGGSTTAYVYRDHTISGGTPVLTADFGFAPLATIGDTIRAADQRR